MKGTFHRSLTVLVRYRVPHVGSRCAARARRHTPETMIRTQKYLAFDVSLPPPNICTEVQISTTQVIYRDELYLPVPHQRAIVRDNDPRRVLTTCWHRYTQTREHTYDTRLSRSVATTNQIYIPTRYFYLARCECRVLDTTNRTKYLTTRHSRGFYHSRISIGHGSSVPTLNLRPATDTRFVRHTTSRETTPTIP